MPIRLCIIILFFFVIAACNDSETLGIEHLPECIQLAITESIDTNQPIYAVRELSSGGEIKYLTLAAQVLPFDHNTVLSESCEEICSYSSHSSTAVECLTNFDWNESIVVWTRN